MKKRAAETVRAYTLDERLYREWCAENGHDPVPVALDAALGWLRHECDRGMKRATLGRRASALSEMNRAAGHPSPFASPAAKHALDALLDPIPWDTRHVTPVDASLLGRMVAITARDSDRGEALDRALLLLGWATALRRSEISALNVEDFDHYPDGLYVRVGDDVIDVPASEDQLTCPVRALNVWRMHYTASTGPLFPSVDRWGNIGGRMSGRAVAEIIKKRIRALGMDDTDYSGESLRAGRAAYASKRAREAEMALRREERRRVGPASRAIAEAIEQGLGATVDDAATLARLAVLLTGGKR